MAGGGISMLETPPWIIGLTFLTFIAITALFDKVIHMLIACLQQRQKARQDAVLHSDELHGKGGEGKGTHKRAHEHESNGGLLAAVKSLVSELAALGFASLMLIAFQNDITSRCVSPQRYLQGKRWLDFEEGVPCCLAKTEGVTPCFLAYRNSSFYELSKTCKAGKDGLPYEHAMGKTDGYYKVDAKGTVKDFPEKDWVVKKDAKYNMSEADASSKYLYTKCYKEVQLGWEECGVNQNLLPAISVTALHEVHLYIFFIAGCHIAINILLICTAYVQALLWKRWLRSPSPAQVLQQTQKFIDEHKDDLAAYGAMLGVSLHEGHDSRKNVVDDMSASLTENPGLRTISENLDSPFDDTKRPQLPETISIHRPSTWKGRLDDGRWTPLQICRRLMRQVYPLAVSKKELEVVQASFLMAHEIHSGFNFSFINYLQLSLEEDFASMVGLGWGSWLFIVCYIFLTSAIGLLLWPIMVIAALIAIFLSIRFIGIIWKQTSGGNVHRMRKSLFPLERPWMYCSFIQFMSFCLAFVFADELFFATQYSPSSCLFNSGFSTYGMVKSSIPVPWWVLFLVNLWMLIALAVVIAPLFSVVVHSGYDYKPQFFCKALQKHLQQVHSHRQASAEPSSGAWVAISKVFGIFVKAKATGSMHNHASTATAAVPAKDGASSAMGGK